MGDTHSAVEMVPHSGVPRNASGNAVTRGKYVGKQGFKNALRKALQHAKLLFHLRGAFWEV